MTDLPFYDALLILTTTVDAFNTGSTTIIIPPLTVIERQLQEDSMKYGIEVLVGSQVGSEFGAFSKPLHHLQICATCIDGPLAQMSTEEFEAEMTRSRPQVLICSVEFLTSRKVSLGAFPIG